MISFFLQKINAFVEMAGRSGAGAKWKRRAKRCIFHARGHRRGAEADKRAERLQRVFARTRRARKRGNHRWRDK